MDKEKKNRNEDKKCQIEPESFQLEKQPIKIFLEWNSGLVNLWLCLSECVSISLGTDN